MFGIVGSLVLDCCLFGIWVFGGWDGEVCGYEFVLFCVIVLCGSWYDVGCMGWGDLYFGCLLVIWEWLWYVEVGCCEMWFCKCWYV